MQFRDLTKEDIEVRVSRVTKGGCALLLYKNARVDMSILDEAVGPERWQRRHYECKGNLFCSVGVRFGDDWVFKDDCGAESYTEKEKGEASDSFKRACFNWGIGRELYTAPFIWVPAARVEIVEKGGKFSTREQFHVEKVAISNGRITGISICNKVGDRVFVWHQA